MENSESRLIRSLVEGPKHMGKGFVCQAITCAAASEEELREFFAYLTTSPKYRSRNSVFVAYRFAVSEGFEDTEEVAASQKLLHLLQRMGVENIVLGVVLWTDAAVQSLGIEMYRSVLEAARSLLESIHSEVVSIRQIKAERRKQSLVELPPLNTVKTQSPSKEKRRRHNKSMDCSYTVEQVHRLPDSVYESSRHKLQTLARQITSSVIIGLQHIVNSPVLSTLLQLLILLLHKVVQENTEPPDLLIGRTLRTTMLQFSPMVLSQRQISAATSLQHRVHALSSETQTSAEVQLVISWADAALQLCLQPTLQALELETHQEPLVPEYQFATTVSVREGRFGTPTQFLFNNKREKRTAQIVTVRKKKKKDEPERKSGLRALTELILQRRLEEQAWGEEVQVAQLQSFDLDPELEAKLLDARRTQMKQEERIERLIHLHLEDIKVAPESLNGIPDEEVFHCIEESELKEMPTGLLMAFAGKLKERRKRERGMRKSDVSEKLHKS